MTIENLSDKVATTTAGQRRAEVPELLAPAGDMAALMAALEAGADAVYLGMKALNARRQARNFGREELEGAVQAVHARGAKAYLTLNTDLAQRELPLAARTLAWAARCGVDAVLVRDPALLALRAAAPGIALHFSTQTCMTNSADIRAAAELGIARVVLAREMTLDEIRAASAVEGTQTEVFAQGALCFSVSGRCLLSSWAGGRSGNRGLCTSPCRVPWTSEGDSPDWPFSMRDLATAPRLDELRQAGVAALKIEGRMKNAQWVAAAVGLYRRALDQGAGGELLRELDALGHYTGRQLTSGYLDGQRTELTGSAGRLASAGRLPGLLDFQSRDVPVGEEGAVDVTVDVDRGGIHCRCACGSYVDEWSLPRTAVRRPEKAVAIGQLLEWLGQEAIAGHAPGRLATNAPDFLLVPRAANRLVDRVRRLVHRASRRERDLAAVELPEAVRPLLSGGEPHPANRRPLGSRVDRVRVAAEQLGPLARHLRDWTVIVEGLTAETLASACRAVGKRRLVVALPAVFFEDGIPGLQRLLGACRRAGLAVEVNSWGGWFLARRAGVRMEGGPGMAVLNSLAAEQLGRLGLRSVTASIEADRRKLEELTAHCPVPCSVVVWGRPALLTSRVELAEGAFSGRVLCDRRQVLIRGRREGHLWVFRPVDPFDLRAAHNPRIRVAHLAMDLVGSDDPAAELRSLPPTHGAFRFNYDRALS
ncbi:MAG TPA: hypothetical protein EYP56_19360 [Planctomycetaceae bacterium]|nr:hypothetical protein [Planctomycetaceae bacterium]